MNSYTIQSKLQQKKAVIVIARQCELQSQHMVIRGYRMSVLTAYCL